MSLTDPLEQSTKPLPQAGAISWPWLRNLVISFEVLARPLTIVLAGATVFWVPFTVTNGEWRVAALGIAAGSLGALGGLKTYERISGKIP